ncbi:MAG: YARHG domain-containing protein [Aristaeellaceae bacterium]
MKALFRRLCALLACLMLLVPSALSEHAYLIPDSNTRYLTEEELWAWDYESLGYILNEIFARHGYNFIPGQKYDNYFRCMPWYTPNADPDNQRACYSQLTSLEWANEHLVKEVRARMRALGTRNEQGKSVWDYFSAGFDVLQGFNYIAVQPNQRWPVYSAPDTAAWRGADGKALVSTTGFVYAAGWESGWLLVMYETNNGSVRVGYTRSGDMKQVPSASLPSLSFDYAAATVTRACSLTDDPARCFDAIVSLRPGQQVTYLTTFFNRYAWAYVETLAGGQRARGFIPADCLELPQDDADTIGR